MKSAAIMGAAVAAAAVLAAQQNPADADTPRCVSHGEYRHLHRFMSLAQARTLVDLRGRPEADSVGGAFFRWSFNGCRWAGPDRVYTAFSYAGFGLDHWSVH